MAQDFAAFARKLDRATAEFTGNNKKQILKQLGDAAATKDAPKAVRADHGGKDHFGGWPKARFTASAKVEGDGVTVGPSNKGVGVWKVAEYGRHPGMTGPAPAPFLKSGKRSTAKRYKRKWNGSTDPQTTWDEAKEIMARETPARAARAVHAALGRVFRG